MYIGIDLGSTNLKVALYDENLQLLGQDSRPVNYIRKDNQMEFDLVPYGEDLFDLLKKLLAQYPDKKLKRIAFTGQAETLVCLDREGKPLCNAISWMDERSVKECEVLAGRFSAEECYRVTGQQAVVPTWPATKILWMKNNRPDVYENVGTYMLLKDYMVYLLTGKKCCDMSIATFSFYFDIYKKCYWQDMLDAIGVNASQLPPLVEPNTVVGSLTEEAAEKLGVGNDVEVNTGTLDHFAGMIGTGNLTPGIMTLSTGTTMVLATMAKGIPAPDCGIAMHYGFLPDTHVMLSVMESGGNCLEWFRRTCLGGLDYDTINKEVAACDTGKSLLFLPYITGVNPPEFDANATGVFYGLRQEHTQFHMARAVMEGVSFALRKNCQHMAANGTPVHSIIATGGGAKSAVWCQMQADITGVPVVVPKVTEAGCLGAAMVAAEKQNAYVLTDEKRYEPHYNEVLEEKYNKFCKLYTAVLETENL